MAPDFKPAKRIVDRDAQPIDTRPQMLGWCPCCLRRRAPEQLSRHHVVPKGVGGDDVRENLVWVCGDGTRGCHGVLTHHNRDGETGLCFEQVAARLVDYVRGIPQIVEYVTQRKYDGWLVDYYGRFDGSVAA